MKTKVCKDCGEEKCESLFFKKHANCKVCHLLKKKKWRKENPEEYKKQTKKYYESTKGEQSKKKKVWIENNREKYNSYWTKRKSMEPEFKLLSEMRSRLWLYLKKGSLTKKNKTFDIVGCSPLQLREYIEKQFVNGMNWENRSSWHIDHIIPLSSANNEEELYKLFHYTNLQPLWAEDNLKKSNKILSKDLI